MKKSAVAGRHLKLSLVGHDRIGIVREVSQVLARHAVNVEDLTTRTASARDSCASTPGSSEWVTRELSTDHAS